MGVFSRDNPLWGWNIGVCYFLLREIYWQEGEKCLNCKNKGEWTKLVFRFLLKPSVALLCWSFCLSVVGDNDNLNSNLVQIYYF